MRAWTHSDWIDLAVAVGTIALAAFAFWQIVADRRSLPRFTFSIGVPGIDTLLETGGRPWIRLRVGNGRRRRTARHTRVILDSYRQTQYANTTVSLGNPELGWPSTDVAAGGGAVVFGGTSKPLDFGSLGVGPIDPEPNLNVVNLMMLNNVEESIAAGTHCWYFQFRLAMNASSVFIPRQFLTPISGGYTARVVVGADEGAARTFDVHFDWPGQVANAEAALRSLTVSVTPMRGLSSSERPGR
jgi:hypothetical protein